MGKESAFGALLLSYGWSCWDRRRLAPATGFPPGPGGGAVGTAYPSGGRGFSGASGRSAPGARLPGGVPISPEKWGERGPGASPLDPRVLIARLLPLASFWRGGAQRGGGWAISGPSACPDLGRFFRVGFHDPEASPWGKLSPQVTDEGRSCTQPFLVEGGTCRPVAFLPRSVG